MIDTRELRKLAKAATPPGGWYVELGDYIYGEKDVTDGEEWEPVIVNTEEGGPVNFEVSVAAFISVANPAAVLELLDRLEAAEKERDALRAEVIHIKEVEFPRKAQAVADGWRGKCERLEAKIAEMERQEPVAEWLPLDSGEDTRRG